MESKEEKLVERLVVAAKTIADFCARFEIRNFEIDGRAYFVKRVDGKNWLSAYPENLKRNLTDDRVANAKHRGLWNYENNWYEFCTITDFKKFGRDLKKIETWMSEISIQHEKTLDEILEDLKTSKL